MLSLISLGGKMFEKRKIKMQQKEIDKLKSINLELLNQNDIMRKQIEMERSESEERSRSILILTNQLDGYKDDYDTLLSELKELRKDYKQKIADFTRLKNEYEKLAKKNMKTIK